MWGGLVVSGSGVFKVLARHGISTRRKRLSLVAGYAAPPEPDRPAPPEPAHLHAPRPGALVQLDCFHIGRLTGTKGRVWQYTAIDVASSFTWAELHVSPLNPAARHCSSLVRRVADALAAAGWKLEAISTDNGSEFRAGEFRSTVATVGQIKRKLPAQFVGKIGVKECANPGPPAFGNGNEGGVATGKLAGAAAEVPSHGRST